MSAPTAKEGSKKANLGDFPALAPFDEHNQRLLQNVHPPDWQNPTPQGRYHLVVIGAGTAGLVTAIVAASLGAKVALVERHLMGGDCLNVGCVPSKGVIGAARAWDPRRRAAFGAPQVHSGGNFEAAMNRMRRLRANISHVDGARRFQDNGVDVFFGTARFASGDVVEVDGQKLRYRRAVIATGARAAAPPIAGLDQVAYQTNETLFSLTELPSRLAVLGGGPIGCEMAQSFAQLGSQVTLFDIAPRVLPREDEDAAVIVQKSLAADGVRLELGAAIESVYQEGEEIAIRFAASSDEADQTGVQESRADELLVAVGRAPNVEDLGLEAVGVRYDKLGIETDDKLRTSNSKIFAIGDVTRSLKFTHLAEAHAAIVIQNALFPFGRARASRLVVPWCTYTTPEVAHVGLYEEEARRLGKKIDVLTVPMDDVDRAVLEGESEGFLKVILEGSSDRILGATLVAAHAGDLIASLSLAITHGIGLEKFATTIHPYPTQAEVIKKAANTWRKRKLSPLVQKLFGVWFRLAG